MSDWLDPELRGMLDDAKELDRPPPDAKAAISAAVRAKVAAAPLPSPPGLRVPAWTLAIAFGAGATLGALAMRESKPSEPPTIPSAELPAPTTTTTTTTSSSAAPIETTTALAPPSASASAPPTPTPVLPAVDLERERVILEAAKVALARGDGDAALDAVHDHQKRFPDGALAEERDALEIQALVATGDRSAASARAARFRTKYPKSLFLPAVQATLEVDP